MAEPLTPKPSEIDNLAWLVWYARKKRGKAEDVARAAWDENPFLRRAEYPAASQGDEGLREAARKVIAEYDARSLWHVVDYEPLTEAMYALDRLAAEEERA